MFRRVPDSNSRRGMLGCAVGSCDAVSGLRVLRCCVGSCVALSGRVMRCRARILIATDSVAKGIDVPNVTMVVHRVKGHGSSQIQGPRSTVNSERSRVPFGGV
eukprot:1144207-Rhodomonas_salina.1